MDDMIYRNDSIAEENIDPNGHPAENKFLKNGAKRFQNVQPPTAKTRK